VYSRIEPETLPEVPVHYRGAVPYIDLLMGRAASPSLATLAASVLLGPCALAASAADAYRAMGIAPAQVLSGSVVMSRVVPGSGKQVVAMTTYLTGSRDEQTAVNVRLDVFSEATAGQLVSIYRRDFGAENGGRVGEGNVELLDLDLDGVNDIVVSFESFAEPLIEQRLGEVLLYGERGFRTVWSGVLEYDSTRAARQVPVERRDRYEREFDLAKTLKARGAELHFQKKVLAIAGERLPQPKIVEESFPLPKP
jgi:hypothetical protein